ncbi:uncharacterized protein si:dkey-262k9.2 isoform X2 [Cheilinus undulatus]|uniref:uncharacterized protein si:dkey-262k9.2 isoform X2 n=2 Tax=Cheilinus undulatus TaxID=241271 RepID=UPI001BD30FA6|nr:uncharacterized protein si:dkey-262k9.2 isoform X2 [Cheilinus undulatus]
MLDPSLFCMTPSKHLKMMRLLFLCLLLLLPAASVSEDTEGSGDAGVDDEDLYEKNVSGISDKTFFGSNAGKTTGVEDQSEENKFTMIIIITAVAVLTLSVAAIVTIMLVRRNMQYRQQGIYSVPTEQQKGAVPFLVE